MQQQLAIQGKPSRQGDMMHMAPPMAKWNAGFAVAVSNFVTDARCICMRPGWSQNLLYMLHMIHMLHGSAMICAHQDDVPDLGSIPSHVAS